MLNFLAFTTLDRYPDAFVGGGCRTSDRGLQIVPDSIVNIPIDLMLDAEGLTFEIETLRSTVPSPLKVKGEKWYYTVLYNVDFTITLADILAMIQRLRPSVVTFNDPFVIEDWTYQRPGFDLVLARSRGPRVVTAFSLMKNFMASVQQNIFVSTIDAEYNPVGCTLNLYSDMCIRGPLNTVVYLGTANRFSMQKNEFAYDCNHVLPCYYVSELTDVRPMTLVAMQIIYEDEYLLVPEVGVGYVDLMCRRVSTFVHPTNTSALSEFALDEVEKTRQHLGGGMASVFFEKSFEFWGS